MSSRPDASGVRTLSIANPPASVYPCPTVEQVFRGSVYVIAPDPPGLADALARKDRKFILQACRALPDGKVFDFVARKLVEKGAGRIA